MAQCGFCRRRFASAQAVRGHLRACDAYLESRAAEQSDEDERDHGAREPKARASAERYGDEPSKAERAAEPKARAFDRLAHVRNEASAEEERLRLRQVQAAHRELDEREAERLRREKERSTRAAEARVAQAREEAEARARVQQEQIERERREREERERQALRRQKIQRAKREAFGWRAPSYPAGVVTAELEAQAQEAIERKLSALPVEDMDDAEVLRIAEAERDRTYRPALDAHRREQEARRREEERARAEDRRREEAKRTRIERGKSYAERELKDASVGGPDRWRVMREVEAALERSVAGDEDQEEIEAIVDDVLEPKLDELEERNRAKRKRELVAHGERFARDQLREVEGLEALTLPGRIRRDLETDLTGDEDEEEVEELVDEILSREAL